MRVSELEWTVARNSGFSRRFWYSSSSSRFLPRRIDHRAARRTPHSDAGMEIARIWRTDQCRSVFLAMMETMETVATETGEAVMPIWAATEEAAIGRSGRMFFLMAMSAMMGSIV